jgi:hypothetical protein
MLKPFFIAENLHKLTYVMDLMDMFSVDHPSWGDIS